MKLSKENKKILKTFSNISEQVVITSDIVSVTDPEKNIGCYYKWQEQVPESFVLSNIGEFLNLIDLYEDPTISKENSKITIKQGKQKNVISCLNDEIANNIKPIDRDTFVENVMGKREIECTVNLSKEQLNNLKKNISILKNTHVVFKDNNIKTFNKMIHSESQSENIYTLELDNVTDMNEKIFRSDSLMKIIEDDYKIKVYNSFLFLEAVNIPIEYMFKLVA